MKIAIVGFGVSGAALLMALNTSKKLDNDITVDIFDPNDEVAVGQAYGEDSSHLLLNAFTSAMSLNPTDQFEFSDWVTKHYPTYDVTVDLVPRTIFGEYAKETISPLLKLDNVTHYKKEIIDIETLKLNELPTYRLTTTDATEYGDYDYLFLALGNPPYQDYYKLKEEENYIHNPYPVSKKLTDIDSKQKVAVIGSGLTAFDLVSYLSHEISLDYPIGVYTNTPYFNSLRVPPYQGATLTYSLDNNWINDEFNKHKGLIPLDRIIEQIDTDLTSNEIDLNSIRQKYDPADLTDTYHTYADSSHLELSKIQAYIAKLSAYLGDLYMSLTKKDQAKYHSIYAGLFNHYQVRLAPDAVANMYKAMINQKLFIVSDLENIYKEETFHLNSYSGKTFEADVVINATGFDFNTDQIGEQNLLLRKLLDKGFIIDKDNRGLSVTWPESKIINQHDGKLDNCFYLGSWLSNTHYGNNNVKALVEKANEIITKYVNI